MDKLPYFPFYTGDWRRDNAIQALTLEEKGAWTELQVIMHDAEPRGFLVLAGQPMSDRYIARCLKVHVNKWMKIRNRLMTLGVVCVTSPPGTPCNTSHNTPPVLPRKDAEIPPGLPAGILYSRQMVRQEQERREYNESKKLGRSDELPDDLKGVNPPVNPGLNRGVPPSSYSPSYASSGEERETKNKSAVDGVDTAPRKSKNARPSPPSPLGRASEDPSGSTARQTVLEMAERLGHRFSMPGDEGG